jgi:hypothetical protein
MNKATAEVPRVTIVTDLLKNARGRFITATFIKTNGQIRTINGRFGVHKGLTGKGLNHDPAEYGQHIIAEKVSARGTNGRFIANRMQYRTVNLNTIQKVTFNGKTLVAAENTIY